MVDNNISFNLSVAKDTLEIPSINVLVSDYNFGVINIRTLVISDIHGCYDELNALFWKVKYSPREDRLILLGDYTDRGVDSKKVVELVKSLHEEFGIVVLRGNHDQMFVDAMLNNEDGLWLNNGGHQTTESYCGFDFFDEGFEWDVYEEAKKFIIDNYGHHINFLKSLPLYYETDNHIFVHAGINPNYEDWKSQPEEDFIWIREEFINNRNTNTKKTIVFGHTPTLHMQDTSDIWFSPHSLKIGIDGACAYGHQLNCLVIHDDYEYATYSVKKGEKL